MRILCRSPKAATCSRNGSGAVAVVGLLGKLMCINRTRRRSCRSIAARSGRNPVSARTG